MDIQHRHRHHDGPDRIKAGFSEAGNFSDGLANAKCAENGKYGFIDTKGEWVIDPLFEAAGDFSDGFAPVRMKGKWGFVDSKGKLFKNITHNFLQNFREGYAACWKYGLYLTYINTKGEEVFNHQIYTQSPTGSWQLPIFQFHEGLVKAKDKSTDIYGYLNDKGETEVKFQFQDAGDFSDGVARVLSGAKWGFVNKKGKMVIPAQFDYAGDFDEGIAPVFSGGNASDFLENKEGVKMGYINKKGELIWSYSK